MTPPVENCLPLADPVPLPAPVGLLRLALLVGFFLHLVPMNIILGGTWLAAVARLRSLLPDGERHARLADLIARTLPPVFAAAVTAGVAALLFLQVLHGQLFFCSSVVMAVPWLAAVAGVLVAYAATYYLALRGARNPRTALIVNLITAVLLVLVASVLAANMTRMLEPADFAREYFQDGRGLHWVPASPTYTPRLAHMLVASLAVAGAFVAVLGVFERRRHPRFGEWTLRVGCGCLSLFTAVNMFFGIWWLVSLPRDVMMQFMGANAPATIALSVGLLGGLLTLVLAGLATVAPSSMTFFPGALTALVCTLATMTVNRDQLRSAFVEAAKLTDSAGQPQWSAMALCLGLAVAASASVFWMARRLEHGRSRGPAR